VLAALETVPRHRFMPRISPEEAYHDGPYPIGYGQTISQPTVVAMMTEALLLRPDSRILEIGTGSGYQTAVLAEIAAEVYSLEVVPELGERAKVVLAELGYSNLHLRVGDGYRGWPEHAPFDGVLLTAAPHDIPRQLMEQLTENGVLVGPVGRQFQQRLVRARLQGDQVMEEYLGAVAFVPMVPEP
jgi:protein-L-isoaspartate(D-aspartate) O-methyltransferase